MAASAGDFAVVGQNAYAGGAVASIARAAVPSHTASPEPGGQAGRQTLVAAVDSPGGPGVVAGGEVGECFGCQLAGVDAVGGGDAGYIGIDPRPGWVGRQARQIPG